MNELLAGWLSQTKADTEERRRRAREGQVAAGVKAARERLSPLDDRLARLLATIPDQVLREGLSLASLQASLRGRGRGNCHPGELGAAMRKLGFERRRNWRGGEDGFRAVWCKVT